VRRSHIRLLSVVVLALVLHAILLHEAYTWRGDTHPDFYIEWVGSRVALRGHNPYSDETTIAIQMGSKGHRVPKGEDQLAFVYPYYRVFLNAPIAFVPYDWATAIWHTLMQGLLACSALLFVRAIRWRASLGDQLLVLAVTVFAYPMFGGLLLGQMAIGVLALMLIAYWALIEQHDFAAGGCLALATLKPQLAILALPFLLFWCLIQRRWHVILAFAVGMAALVGASFLIFPSWLEEFVRVILRYPSYKYVQTGPGYLLAGCCRGLVTWLIGTVCIAWLLFAWWLSWRGRRLWLEGAFALSLAMTCFLLPQTSIVNQIVLLPAILVLLRDMPTWAARFAVSALVVGGSWLAFAVLYNTRYDLNMSLPPVLVLLALAIWYLAKGLKDAEPKPIPETA
jgi:hypothetical protein